VKAIFLTNARQFGEEPGQVLAEASCLFVTCPNCGMRYVLRIPPFTFDAAAKSVGPASIALNDPECKWHGYLHNGEWKGDRPCLSISRRHCVPKVN
jgi:hypothetical protein